MQLNRRPAGGTAHLLADLIHGHFFEDKITNDRLPAVLDPSPAPFADDPIERIEQIDPATGLGSSS